MKEKPSTKFDFPSPKLSPSEISALIAEAVPSVEVNQPRTMQPIGDNPYQDDNTKVEQAKSTSQRRGRRVSRNPNAHKIQIEIDAQLIKSAKLRAVEDEATFASIVEHSLRAFLKL